MKTISRWSFRFLWLLILIVALSWLITRLDLLWPWAIDSTRERIDADPDFESRLVRYASLGQTAERVLTTVAPGSETLYDIISVAKNRENTWKLLTNTLEKKVSGLGIALDTLSYVIEKVDKLRGSFQAVQQLTEVAAAGSNFRFNPSQASLIALGEQSGGSGAQALSDIRLDLDGLADGVRSLNQNLDRLADELGRTGNSSGLDAELARRLYPSLLVLDQPLQELDHNVQSLRSDLARDVGTLQSIHWRVLLASTADKIAAKIPALPTIREWARTVWSNLRLALYVAVTLLVSGIAFNIGDWYDRRRIMHRQPEIRVVVQQPPASRPEPVSRRQEVRPKELQPTPEPVVRDVQQAAPPANPAPSSRRTALEGFLLRRGSHGVSQVVPLPSQGKITLGSGPGNEVKIAGAGVSPYHAAICAARTCYFIQDLDNTGGTTVNGEKLTGDRQLQSGDVIAIGNEEFEFTDQS